MSVEQENFESLKKLLALKRHEVPPPGYHEQFASEIRARSMAGEHHQSDLWRELGDEASWLQRMWQLFSDRPTLAGAFGMAVCALALTGIYFVQKPAADDGLMATTLTAPAPVSLASGGSVVPSASSTNPISAANSLFNTIGVPQTAPVSFTPMFSSNTN